jgi:hypothetical protein
MENNKNKTKRINYKGFSKIEPILYKAAKEYKLEAALYKYKLCRHWEKIINGFIKDSQGKTKIMDFQKGVLTIACLSGQLAYEIKVLARRIINELNNLLGRQLVFAISVEV